jgi:hypothetical protein
MSQGVCNAHVLPLMMLPSIKSWWAASLFDAGIKTVEQLARTPPALVEEALRASVAFASRHVSMCTFVSVKSSS